MTSGRGLLVVDDEDAICQAVKRIFSGQGFEVAASGDPAEALKLAARQDFSAILLDVCMPGMDGLEFLRQLRRSKPTTPVVFITGYPSVDDAASAMRLGALDYVTKPFTPDQITRTVQHALAERERRVQDLAAAARSARAAPAAAPWTPVDDAVLFLDEAWYRLGRDGTVRIGAVPARLGATEVESVRLPTHGCGPPGCSTTALGGEGEQVYQGLPAAAIDIAGRPPMIVAAPLSGEVVEVNAALVEQPNLLFTDPCGEGWMFRVAPSRLQQEAAACRPRRIALVAADQTTARDYAAQLAVLGCRTLIVGPIEPVERFRELDCPVVLVDDAAPAEDGPQFVKQLRAVAPEARIVVMAAPDARWEAEYRRQAVFYYAVQPFADQEIVDILDAAFRARRDVAPPPSAANVVPPPSAATLLKWSPRGAGPGRPLCKVQVSNNFGRRVALLSAGKLLVHDRGLGHQLCRVLAAAGCTVETVAGLEAVSPARVLSEGQACDRLITLQARDLGRLPGSLVREAADDLVPAAWQRAGKVISFCVQPDIIDPDSLRFDPRTTAALSRHLAREMLAC